MNVLLVIRVKKRTEPDPGYAMQRLRDQAGEVVDWLPDNTHPGNSIIDNPEFRIIRVTGAGMTAAIADMLCAPDLLKAQDIGKGFFARGKLWQIKFSDLPPAALNALKIKVPFATRGTIYDASYTAAQVQSVWRQKVDEPRDGQGFPTDDGQTLDDL